MTFGRDEKLLYAFSKNTTSILTLLDTDGNIKWQLVVRGFKLENSLIQYKALNSFSDMGVAVVGSTTLNFNRIISSSISPYSVSDSLSKAFKGEISLNRKIRGLYIRDIDNAIALMYN